MCGITAPTPAAGHTENTACSTVPCAYRGVPMERLPGNALTCHTTPSLRLFVPNSLTVYHHSFISGGCAFNVFLQVVISVSLCSGCSLTATTAPSLRPARPERFPYKVPVSPDSHHHPFPFFSKRRGKIMPSGRCSDISGS
jgi:hypothetical protein